VHSNWISSGSGYSLTHALFVLSKSGHSLSTRVEGESEKFGAMKSLSIISVVNSQLVDKLDNGFFSGISILGSSERVDGPTFF
jgi:hypothetical protein